MQPTEQILLPHLLISAAFAAGVTEVPLPTAYDFLLTNISLAVTPEQTGSLLVGLSSGLYMLSVPFEASASPEVAEGPTWEGMLPCPAGGTLYVQAAGPTISAAISGWLALPTAASILPT